MLYLIQRTGKVNQMQNKFRVLVKVTQKQPAWCMIISAQDHKEAIVKARQAGAVEIRDCQLIKQTREEN